MRDILPPSSAVWNQVETAARKIFAQFNYHEIRTPIVEETALFARGVGEETDIVSKEMYTFEDRDGSSLTSAAGKYCIGACAPTLSTVWISSRICRSFSISVPCSGANVLRRGVIGSSFRLARRRLDLIRRQRMRKLLKW